jgi:hypothetical protein
METPHFVRIDPGNPSPVLVDFVKEFNMFLDYHKEHEQASLSEYLFKVGTQVKEGKRNLD